MHLDDEQVQCLLHGELTPPPAADARAHLAECAECRSRVGEAEQEEGRIFGLLRAVDHPPPQVAAESIRALAVGKMPRWGRLAAGIVLALAMAGVAYAAPGSPLPAVVRRMIEWVAPSARPRNAPVLPAQSEVPPAAGIAVAPGSRFTIRFPGNLTDGVATVSLTDGGDVVVRTVQGEATFTADADRLSIAVSGPVARFEILIPRSAPSVRIAVAGRPVFVSEASRVVTVARVDSTGRYLVTLEVPASP